MKKLMLFGLGVVASLSVLTSCKKEELAAPTVSFQNGENSYVATSENDLNRVVTITVDAPAKLETIKIYRISDSGKTTDSVITSFTSSTQHIFQYMFTPGKFEVEATDKENQTTSAYFTFTGYTSTAGEIVSYSTKIMGAQFNNGLGSFLSTSNGTVYSAANAKLNSSLIDFVYCYRGVTSNVTYKAIIGAPSDADVKIGHANTTGFSSWSNYNNTLFGYSSLTSSEFDAIVDDSEFNSIPTLNETHVFDLAEGDIVAFKTQAGKYGYFRVKSINVGVQGGDAIQKYQDGSIEIDVKVQK